MPEPETIVPPVAPAIDRPAPGATSPDGFAGPARIEEVDALRGFALLGILMANVMAVSTLMTLRIVDGNYVLPFDGTVDALTDTVVSGLFLGKFFLLFSFLFGYSFTLQLDAAARAGVPAVPRLLRRCAALFALGAAHVALLWFGDILTLYALLCLVLVLLRNVRPLGATALGCAILLALVADTQWSWGLLSPSGDLGWFVDEAQHGPGFTGGFLDTLRTQLAVGPRFAVDIIWPGQGPQALALFLFGFAAGKRRLLGRESLERLRPWLGRVQAVGLLVGGSVTAWVTIAEYRGDEVPSAVYSLYPMTDALVTAFYIATVLRLCRGRAGRYVVGALAPAGRMAATNYIAQSVAFMFLCTGYGLALVDDVPPLGIVGLATVVYVAQLAASAWWLRRHPNGPVEWALRAATYARRPTWRHPQAGAQAQAQD